MMNRSIGIFVLALLISSTTDCWTDEDQMVPLQRQYRQATEKANSDVRSYSMASGDDSSPTDQIAKLKETARQSIEDAIRIEFQLQQQKIDRSRNRLDALEQKLKRSVAAIDRLVDEELKAQVSSASAVPPDPRFATPENTLEYFRQQGNLPDSGNAADCLTDDALNELCGLILQGCIVASAMSQLVGQIGVDDNPSSAQMNGQFDAFLKSQAAQDPPDSAMKAFQRLAETTLGGLFGSQDLAAKPIDAATYRAAAGYIESPREFWVAYLRFVHSISDDSEDQKSKRKPQWSISVKGDLATAVDLNSDSTESNTILSSEASLAKINGEWKITQLLTERTLQEIQRQYKTMSIMSQLQAQGVQVSQGTQTPPSLQPSTADKNVAVQTQPNPYEPSKNNGRYPGGATNGEDQRSLAYSLKQFNLQSAANRKKLFDPAIPDLTLEQLKNGFLATAKIYEKDGMLMIAKTLTRIGETGRLPGEIVSHVVASGVDSRDEAGNQRTKQIAPGLITRDGSGGNRLVLLRPIELIYNRNGQSSTGYGVLKHKKPAPAPKADSENWNDLLELTPEVGTSLVMVDNHSDNSRRMLPVVKQLAQKASVTYIGVPIAKWKKLFSDQATHFLLLKDRQLVAVRSGLATEKRMVEFVSKAEDCLTPASTGVDPKSLVRIDCFINPGKDNIGSQQGSVFQLTGAVIAQHEGRALIIGPSSIARYLGDGYACLIALPDDSGKLKHYPLDVLSNGPAALHDGGPAIDLGSTVYIADHLPPLSTVHLASENAAFSAGDLILTGSFMHPTQVGPIREFKSNPYWQSQTILRTDQTTYGIAINGPKLIEIGFGSEPVSHGFSFNATGQLIGRYALGGTDFDDPVFTIFSPRTTNAVVKAALEKLGDDPLANALKFELSVGDSPELD